MLKRSYHHNHLTVYLLACSSYFPVCREAWGTAMNSRILLNAADLKSLHVFPESLLFCLFVCLFDAAAPGRY